MDEEERLVSLEKKDLREYETGTSSPMPAAGDVLKDEEVADMIACLSL